MPRIKSVDVNVLPIHTGQDPASLSRAFEVSTITKLINACGIAPCEVEMCAADDVSRALAEQLNDDLLRAVSADMGGNWSDPANDSEMSISDIWQAWNNGYGIVAACILHGATECAHVSAVQWAHAFNGTLGEGFANWTNSAQSEQWWSYCLEHVTVCGSCETHNFDADAESTCGNCLAPMSDGHPLGVEQSEFDEMVYGYVSAATWSSLEREPERDSDGLATFKIGTSDVGTQEIQALDEDDARARFALVSESAVEWVEVERPESGSDPHEFGPDDLDADVLREIRQECADYVRANLSDLKAYVEIQGTTVDHPRAVGGIPMGDHESSAFETAGYEIYMDGAGTGAGFWARDLGDLGERLSSATKGMSSEHLGIWLNSEDGRIYR